MPWRKEIEEYLDKICSYVKYKRDRQAIREEIGAHINERIWDLKHDGLNEEEAVARAIESMGDADSIGISLNKVHNPILGWIFYITNMAAKLVIGLVIVLFVVSLISEIEPFKPGRNKEDIVYEKKLDFKGIVDDTVVEVKKVQVYKGNYVWIEFLEYPKRISAINNNTISDKFEVYENNEMIKSMGASTRMAMFHKRCGITFNIEGASNIYLIYDKYNRDLRFEIPVAGEDNE